MQIFKENIAMFISDDNSEEMEKLKVILKEKQKEQVKPAHAKKDYFILTDEIDILRDKKQELLVKRAETEGMKKRIEKLINFLPRKNHQLKEYDEGMVRQYIEEIRVYEDNLTICFKLKLEVEIIR